MKLDHLLDRIQSKETRVKQETDEDPKERESAETDGSNRLISMGTEVTTNGLMAIGGCRRCERTFVNRLDLIHHFTDHFPSVFYSFETQTQESNFLGQLAQFLAADQGKSTNEVKHKRGTHVYGNAKEDKAPPHSTDSLYYHMCPHCCLTFSETRSFEGHLKTHLSKTLSTPTFECNQCEMRCNNMHLLEEHRRLHAKLCYLCGEQFDTTFDLNMHMGSHFGHPYNCKDCGKAFESRKGLAEHNKTHRNFIENAAESGEVLLSKALSNESPPKKEKKEHDRPTSLLTSNLYFNNLSKNLTRRRRVRILKK